MALGPTQPPTSMGIVGTFPGGKAAGTWSWPHKPPSSADFNNAWGYTATPSNVMVCLIKHRIRCYGPVLS
jgi:hypothetical protein